MPEKELITLVSIASGEADAVRKKLETEGISCFMKSDRRKSRRKPAGKPVDIRVYMKDLDRALLLIADEKDDKTEEQSND